MLQYNVCSLHELCNFRDANKLLIRLLTECIIHCLLAVVAVTVCWSHVALCTVIQMSAEECTVLCWAFLLLAMIDQKSGFVHRLVLVDVKKSEN